MAKENDKGDPAPAPPKPPKKKAPAACTSCDGALVDGYCEACDVTVGENGDAKPADVAARLAALEKRIEPLESLGKLADTLSMKFLGKKASETKPEDVEKDLDQPGVGAFIKSAISSVFGIGGAPVIDVENTGT
jgi:hypothetical protein